MTPCRFATDTGRRWCNCPTTCTEIECRNPERLAALLPSGAGRTDAASYHTKYGDEFATRRELAPFVLVRSAFCAADHCFDFYPQTPADPNE